MWILYTSANKNNREESENRQKLCLVEEGISVGIGLLQLGFVRSATSCARVNCSCALFGQNYRLLRKLYAWLYVKSCDYALKHRNHSEECLVIYLKGPPYWIILLHCTMCFFFFFILKFFLNILPEAMKAPPYFQALGRKKAFIMRVNFVVALYCYLGNAVCI